MTALAAVQTILVIEDNPADVYLVKEAMIEHRLNVAMHVLEDGETAIEYIAEQDRSGEPAAELVLLDLNLPKRSGFDVLEALRVSPCYRSVPVVVLTSSEAARDKDRATKLGADRYVRKPSDFDQFLQIGLILKEILAESETRKVE